MIMRDAERFAKLIKRRFLQVHGLRQVEIVKFLEMMPQRGIDLSLAGGGIENVVVTNALFLREFDRQE